MAAEFLERMGARIRERREALDLSRAEVARQMPGKVNENQIYRWEKGRHNPNPDTLQALADVLKCDVSFFITPARDEAVATPDLALTGDRSQLDAIDAKLDQIVERLNNIDAALVVLFSERVLVAGGRRDIEQARRRLAAGGS